MTWRNAQALTTVRPTSVKWPVFCQPAMVLTGPSSHTMAAIAASAGQEGPCQARAGREGQAALTALAGSMLDEGVGEAARRASRFEGGLGPISSDPGDPADESAALRARAGRW